MSLGRPTAVAAAVAGTVGAAVATLLLAVRFGGRTSVLAGFGMGVAVVGVALAAGMAGWVRVSEVDGDGLYPAAAGMASASALVFTAADRLASGGDHTTVSLALVAAGVLVVVGFSLVFVGQVRTAGDG